MSLRAVPCRPIDCQFILLCAATTCILLSSNIRAEDITYSGTGLLFPKGSGGDPWGLFGDEQESLPVSLSVTVDDSLRRVEDSSIGRRVRPDVFRFAGGTLTTGGNTGVIESLGFMAFYDNVELFGSPLSDLVQINLSATVNGSTQYVAFFFYLAPDTYALSADFESPPIFGTVESIWNPLPVDGGAYLTTTTSFGGPMVNQPPQADAGSDQTVECDGELTLVTLDAGQSTDPDGDSLEYEWSVPAESGAVLEDPTSSMPDGYFPVGITQVSLTVTDGNGGVDVDAMLVSVVDTTPPVLSVSTDPLALWPPNHSVRTIFICVAASDACSAPEQLSLLCTVSSNEPDDATGDGTFSGDVNGHDGFLQPVDISDSLSYDPELDCFFAEINLRAERDGDDAGREYSIVCSVTDNAGNSDSTSCVVVVPHDRRRK